MATQNRTKQVNAKKRKAKKRNRIIIFALEIVLLIVMLVVLWAVLKGTEVGTVVIKEEDIKMNEKVESSVAMKGYRNIALFGVDSTTGALTKNTRSDTIMIASINLDSGDVKLISVYRDTYLNKGNDKYNKCNGAYADGGPQQAINMLNMNLDLNITDFVTVGFAGLSETINALGGVYIDVDSEEILHINNYQQCIAEDLKCSYTPVTETGYQLLDGIQATAYCRIRYTAGDDYKRTERQREVLQAVADKAKNASATNLIKIANDVFPNVYTSLKLDEIISLLGEINKYQVVADGGFPEASMRGSATIGSKGSCVLPLDLESNVVWLHEFLFDEQGYEVSKEIKEYSDKIRSDISPYIQ